MISEDDFRVLSSACKEEQTRLEKSLKTLQDKLDTAIYNKEHTDGVRTLISKFKDIETLDRYTVELLIHRQNRRKNNGSYKK